MVVGITGAILVAGLLASAPGNVNFDGLPRGIAPSNWTTLPGGDASQPWRVRFDASAPSRGNVLESSSNAEDSPVAVFNPVICRDGDLSVKFRIDPRASDGAAGIVWRYQDANNYYILDFSASRRMIGIYRVQNGTRVQVRIRGARAGASVLSHEIKAGEWHIARVSFRGNNIRVYFGNRKLFEADGAGSGGAGKAGVITSGATIAAFDDFRIEKKS